MPERELAIVRLTRALRDVARDARVAAELVIQRPPDLDEASHCLNAAEIRLHDARRLLDRIRHELS